MADKKLSVEYVAVVDKFVGGLKKAADSSNSFGDRMKALKPALAGLGTALGVTAGFVAKLGQDHQRSAVIIQTAIANTGKSWDQYEPKVEAAVKQQEKFGHNAADTQTALGRLTIALGSPDKALQGLSAAANIAALKHISLTDAAVQLAKAAGGSTRSLKELGINTAELAPTAEAAQKAYDKARDTVNKLADGNLKSKSAQEAYKVAVQKLKEAQDNLSHSGDRWSQILSAVQQKTHGLAENESKTLGGRLSDLKAHVEDIAGSFGQKYGPALLGVGSVMSTVGPMFLGLGKAIVGMAGLAADAFKGLFSLFAANPWLLAIVGLVIVVTLIVTHWKQVSDFLKHAWSDIKQWAGDIWHAIYDFFKKILPLIVYAVLGPIGLLVLEIVKHWKDVKQWTSDAWNFIKDALKAVWDAIKGFFTAYFNIYKAIVLGVWDAIKAATSAVWNTIKTVISTVINAVKSVITTTINAIKSAWDSIWNGMKDTASAVVNAVLGFFSGLVEGIRHMVDAIGGFFSKLAFWRHSPSQLEINAELSTKNAVASFQRLRDGMSQIFAPMEAPLLSGPLVPSSGGFSPTFAAPAVGANSPEVEALLAAILDELQKHRPVFEVDGKTLATVVEKQNAYVTRART